MGPPVEGRRQCLSWELLRYDKRLRFCKKKFLIGALFVEIRLFRVVLRLVPHPLGLLSQMYYYQVSVASMEADYSKDSTDPRCAPHPPGLSSQVYYSQVSVASVEADYIEDSETTDILPILRGSCLKHIILGVSSKRGG
jgi:hypothetical protein